jgi:hypothetical protein
MVIFIFSIKFTSVLVLFGMYNFFIGQLYCINGGAVSYCIIRM